MTRKNNLVLVVFIYLLLLGIFISSETRTGLQEFVIFAVLTALVLASSIFIYYYYLTDKNSFKQRFISICMSFIKITLYFILVRELTGFSLDYSIIILFFIALLIFTSWELLDLNLWEKGVLVLVLITIFVVTGYESADPKTPYQLYRSELNDVTNYEEIHDLLIEDYQQDLTSEDFQALQPYLSSLNGKRLLEFSQSALLEFEDGQIIMLETSREDLDDKLRFSNIELLPEEVSSHLRHYPQELERNADFPKDIKDENYEAIIETRGAFISHANPYQKIDWYEKLIGVFGEKEVWDSMWDDLEGLRAPEGPVQGAGTSDEGFLEFRLQQDWEVDQKVLDEIYFQFKDYAAKNDIPELPVVFKWAD